MSGQRAPGDFLSALKAIAASDGRRRTLTNKIKASDAADLAARSVPCTCFWNTGDHAPECDTQREWDRAYDRRLDELEEGV